MKGGLGEKKKQWKRTVLGARTCPSKEGKRDVWEKPALLGNKARERKELSSFPKGGPYKGKESDRDWSKRAFKKKNVERKSKWYLKLRKEGKGIGTRRGKRQDGGGEGGGSKSPGPIHYRSGEISSIQISEGSMKGRKISFLRVYRKGGKKKGGEKEMSETASMSRQGRAFLTKLVKVWEKYLRSIRKRKGTRCSKKRFGREWPRGVEGRGRGKRCKGRDPGPAGRNSYT